MILKNGKHKCDACGRIKGAIRAGIGAEDNSPLVGYPAGVCRFGASWHVSFDYCADDQKCFVRAARVGIRRYQQAMKI